MAAALQEAINASRASPGRCVRKVVENAECHRVLMKSAENLSKEYGPLFTSPEDAGRVRLLLETGMIPFEMLTARYSTDSSDTRCKPVTFLAALNVVHRHILMDVIKSNPDDFSRAVSNVHSLLGDLVLVFLRDSKEISLAILEGELGEQVKAAFVMRTLTPARLWKAVSTVPKKIPCAFDSEVGFCLIEKVYEDMLMHRQNDSSWKFCKQIEAHPLDVSLFLESYEPRTDVPVQSIVRVAVTLWCEAIVKKDLGYLRTHFTRWIIHPDLLLLLLQAPHGYTLTDEYSCEGDTLLDFVFNGRDGEHPGVFYQSNPVPKGEWLSVFVQRYSELCSTVSNRYCDEIKEQLLRERTQLFKYMFASINDLFLQKGLITAVFKPFQESLSTYNQMRIIYNMCCYIDPESPTFEAVWFNLCDHLSASFFSLARSPTIRNLIRTVEYMYIFFCKLPDKSPVNAFRFSTRAYGVSFFKSLVFVTRFIIRTITRMNEGVEMDPSVQQKTIETLSQVARRLSTVVIYFVALGSEQDSKRQAVNVIGIDSFDVLFEFIKSSSKSGAMVRLKAVEHLSLAILWAVSDITPHYVDFVTQNTDIFDEVVASDGHNRTFWRAEILHYAVIARIFNYGRNFDCVLRLLQFLKSNCYVSSFVKTKLQMEIKPEHISVILSQSGISQAMVEKGVQWTAQQWTAEHATNSLVQFTRQPSRMFWEGQNGRLMAQSLCTPLFVKVAKTILLSNNKVDTTLPLLPPEIVYTILHLVLVESKYDADYFKIENVKRNFMDLTYKSKMINFVSKRAIAERPGRAHCS